jgi:hypothetical protein
VIADGLRGHNGPDAVGRQTDRRLEVGHPRSPRAFRMRPSAAPSRALCAENTVTSSGIAFTCRSCRGHFLYERVSPFVTLGLAWVPDKKLTLTSAFFCRCEPRAFASLLAIDLAGWPACGGPSRVASGDRHPERSRSDIRSREVDSRRCHGPGSSSNRQKCHDSSLRFGFRGPFLTHSVHFVLLWSLRLRIRNGLSP